MENFGDSIYSIKKYDDKIFAAASLSGLHVIDISNPKNLKEITSYDTKDYTLNVAADKNRAFVASDYGLEVIDINNTDKPKEIGNFETSGESWSIKVKDNYAYVIGWKYGLKVVDISDVNFPKIVGHLKTDFATDILIDKNYAYITNDYAGVSIIDIKDPKNPTLISSVKTPAAWGITKHNDKLLINDLEKGLLIIDIKNKENPQIIASLPLQEKKRFKIRYLLSPSYNMDDFRRDIKIKDNLAFMANGSRGVEIIDISDINNPKFVSNIPTLGTAVALSISKNILYIAEKEEGVETADITNPLSAKIINKIKTNGKAMDLAFYDSIMLVADANMGLTSFSISALSDLAKEESKDFVIGYNTLGISVVNDKIFITDENSGLQIFKIIDENKQALIKKFVNYIYQNIMDREPDANGLDYWSNEFYKGVIPTQNAIKFFFQSDEFQSKQLNNDEFITILYKTIFQRKPDLEGKQFWLSKLNEDIKREDIIDQFLKSKEFTKLIKSFGID